MILTNNFSPYHINGKVLIYPAFDYIIRPSNEDELSFLAINAVLIESKIFFHHMISKKEY